MFPIIEVNNLSKSFIISHEGGKEKYTALRDVMTKKAKKLFSFSSNPISKEEFWALKDVNFTIQQGDRVGIIGRNGAGKSTLLKILSRITEPTKGSIKIRGRVASLLEVGTGFHPELTGRENIFLNGAILGMSRTEIKKHFDAIVDFSEVEKFLDTPVKRYSSGMYVRLAFAVAAHLEPEILVVDEVLAVGDAQFQKKCLGKMEDVSKNEGRTVLFVSHNISAVVALCNTGILLSKGEISYMGNIGDVINAYTNKTSYDDKSILGNTAGLKWWLNGIYSSQYNSKTTHLNIKDKVSFTIDFEGKQERKVSFELLIKNSNHHPVLFIPFGIGQNINFDVAPGKYTLYFEMLFPHLSLGEYYVDVYIVESLVERIAVFQNALCFEVIASYVEDTGWNFENNTDLGNIIWKISDYNLQKSLH